jgi:molybdopterin-guanine dinucleotide biosynthesis protein A
VIAARRPAPKLAGLVVCGGASRRMGSDKALVEVEGRPLVLRVAERLREIADPVILAPGRPGRLGRLGYLEVADEVADAGPLAGLVAGLAASPHELTAVVAVDMPFASARLFALLAGLHDREHDAVVPVSAHGPEPLHAVYARSAVLPLRSALLEGRLDLRAALTGLRVRVVLEREWIAADPTRRFALNVNRPEDLPLSS